MSVDLKSLASGKNGVILSLGTLLAIGAAVPNLKHVTWLLETPEKAHAGYQKADEVESKFDEYLVEQRSYTKAQQEFNQKLTEIQANQIQAPTHQVPANAPVLPVPRRTPTPSPWTFKEYDGTTESFWCCRLTEHEACWDSDEDGRNAWEPC